MKWIAAIVFICLAAFCMLQFSRPPKELQFYRPVFVLYNGYDYIHRGDLLYALPEGLESLGAVNRVKYMEEQNDLDGNEDGYIFMDPQDPSVLYFQWKSWDTSVDGREPYLILCREE